MDDGQKFNELRESNIVKKVFTDCLAPVLWCMGDLFD